MKQVAQCGTLPIYDQSLSSMASICVTAVGRGGARVGRVRPLRFGPLVGSPCCCAENCRCGRLLLCPFWPSMQVSHIHSLNATACACVREKSACKRDKRAECMQQSEEGMHERDCSAACPWCGFVCAWMMFACQSVSLLFRSMEQAERTSGNE